MWKTYLTTISSGWHVTGMLMHFIAERIVRAIADSNLAGGCD